MILAPVISFDLPLPPSANACWRNGRGGVGRYRTDAYRKWIESAASLAQSRWSAQGKPVFGKGYTVTISAGLNRRRDLDNLAKPIIDTLGAAIDLPNDRWCDRIEMDREGPQGRVVVTIIGGAFEA